MHQDELLEFWLQEEAQPFEGWNFSYLNGRLIEDQPVWSYSQRASELMQSSTSVVDLDTGGGERLLDLQQHWPRRIVATENYLPNAHLAHKRLSPLGVSVIAADSDLSVALPFVSEAFDLVLNRNSGFYPAEVARILTKRGIFLTNQVHGLALSDLLALFGVSPQWPNATPETYVPLLKAAGMTILNLVNWQGKLHFTDVGALVYYLKAIPWLVPNFNVTANQNILFRLQEQIEESGELTFEARSYLIEAHM